MKQVKLADGVLGSMRKSAKEHDQTSPPETLKGWQQIAAYLGHPAAVVQRWAAEGMPVRRQGRYVETTADELNAWLGKQAGKPVHVATEESDLTAELKRGLAFVRQEHAPSAATKSESSQKKRKE